MKSITLTADVKSIPALTDFINNELESRNCLIKTVTQIDIAVDEIFSNIAFYAYGKRGGEASVFVEVTDEPAVILRFEDRGVPYDPLTQEAPDISLPVEKRSIGGLGIHIVRQLMDEVTYEYRDGKNILRVKKFF